MLIQIRNTAINVHVCVHAHNVRTHEHTVHVLKRTFSWMRGVNVHSLLKLHVLYMFIYVHGDIRHVRTYIHAHCTWTYTYTCIWTYLFMKVGTVPVHEHTCTWTYLSMNVPHKKVHILEGTYAFADLDPDPVGSVYDWLFWIQIRIRILYTNPEPDPAA